MTLPDPAMLRTIARAHWADAQALPDATLDRLLSVAAGDCIAYAPAALVASVQPADTDRLALGVVYQAREIAAAASRSGDVIGIGDYAIRSRPLIDSVRQILRPATRTPAAG